MASSTEVLHDSTVDSVIRGYGDPTRYCHEVTSCRNVWVLLIRNFACLPNFRANKNQFPQRCQIIKVSKFLGIYGIVLTYALC